MAKNDKLKQVSVKIGSAMGKANRKARKIAAAGSVAQEELHAIGKQVEALKKQLQATTKRLKKAIS